MLKTRKIQGESLLQYCCLERLVKVKISKLIHRSRRPCDVVQLPLAALLSDNTRKRNMARTLSELVLGMEDRGWPAMLVRPVIRNGQSKSWQSLSEQVERRPLNYWTMVASAIASRSLTAVVHD